MPSSLRSDSPASNAVRTVVAESALRAVAGWPVPRHAGTIYSVRWKSRDLSASRLGHLMRSETFTHDP